MPQEQLEQGRVVQRELMVLEASEARINLIAKQLKMKPEDVKNWDAADPTGGKYLTWICRQARPDPETKRAQIVWPEDVDNVRGMLTHFDRLKRSLGQNFKGERDVLKVPTMGDLVQIVRDNSEQVSKGEERRLKVERGMKVLVNNRELNGHRWTLIQIDTHEAYLKVLRNAVGPNLSIHDTTVNGQRVPGNPHAPNWCVKDPQYFYSTSYWPPYFYLERDDKPYRLLNFTPGGSRECRNTADVSASYTEYEALGLDPENFLNYPTVLSWYANNKLRGQDIRQVVRTKFPKLEAEYAKDAHKALEYAKLIKAPFPEGEAAILSLPLASDHPDQEAARLNPQVALDYAVVTRQRFAEAEPMISQSPQLVCRYMNEVIQRPQPPEVEREFAADPSLAYAYAINIPSDHQPAPRPFPAGEAAIATSSRESYWYARLCLGGRFKEGEATVAAHPRHAYYYAADVVGGRWPEGEAAIATDGEFSLRYSALIRDRFPAGEAAIQAAGLTKQYNDQLKSKK